MQASDTPSQAASRQDAFRGCKQQPKSCRPNTSALGHSYAPCSTIILLRYEKHCAVMRCETTALEPCTTVTCEFHYDAGVVHMQHALAWQPGSQALSWRCIYTGRVDVTGSTGTVTETAVRARICSLKQWQYPAIDRSSSLRPVVLVIDELFFCVWLFNC
jgi:hypothetical protein